ncbi:hypothetical protein V3C41_02110 [Paenarthrobacter nicotinovorans]|uniref:Uncharacterized protein n=1 Tax=Paenarthrobacter nicotinovorans TaxID=29320 RepID=A0ABV0GMZ3_PAENI
MKAKRRSDPRGDESNARALILACILLLGAVGLFWLTSVDEWFANAKPLQVTLNQIAGLIIATAILSVGWDLIGRRRFAAEILDRARLSADIVDAGIMRVTDQYLDEVEWSELFEGVHKIDVVVAYGRTWRNTHEKRLRNVASRPGTRLRFFLPDPDDDLTMQVLSGRFNMPKAALEATVREAITEFSKLKSEGGGDVEVHVRSGDAVFSCYRFDNRAVLTTYSHSKERRTSVPTFVVSTGKLYQFIQEEIEAIESQGCLIFPTESKG